MWRPETRITYDPRRRLSIACGIRIGRQETTVISALGGADSSLLPQCRPAGINASRLALVAAVVNRRSTLVWLSWLSSVERRTSAAMSYAIPEPFVWDESFKVFVSIFTSLMRLMSENRRRISLWIVMQQNINNFTSGTWRHYQNSVQAKMIPEISFCK